MKAYEFKTLLRKYRNRTIRPSEYARFEKAVEDSRRLRQEFRDVTGEKHPTFPEVKRPDPRSSTLRNSANRNSSRSRPVTTVRGDRTPRPAQKSPARSSVEAVPRPSLKPSPRARPASGDRQSRMGRGRNRPIKTFGTFSFWLIGVTLIILLLGGILWLGFPGRPDPDSGDLNSPVQPVETSPDLTNTLEGSFVSGSTASDADRLLQVQASDFEVEDLKSVEVPITGLEQAIERGIREALIDPEEALKEIEPVNAPEMDGQVERSGPSGQTPDPPG